MKLDLYQQLKADYPDQFAKIRGPCECGDGWLPIVRDVCEALKGQGMEWFCIKEKFGGLRMQTVAFPTGDEDLIRTVLIDAEKRAAQTCETCGKPGSCRTICGWLKTTCDEHAQPVKVSNDD